MTIQESIAEYSRRTKNFALLRKLKIEFDTIPAGIAGFELYCLREYGIQLIRSSAVDGYTGGYSIVNKNKHTIMVLKHGQ